MPRLFCDEGGLQPLADRLLEIYPLDIRCPRCGSRAGEVGFIKDQAGKASIQGLPRRRFSCRVAKSAKPIYNCQGYQSAGFVRLAKRQLGHDKVAVAIRQVLAEKYQEGQPQYSRLHSRLQVTDESDSDDSPVGRPLPGPLAQIFAPFALLSPPSDPDLARPGREGAGEDGGTGPSPPINLIKAWNALEQPSTRKRRAVDQVDIAGEPKRLRPEPTRGDQAASFTARDDIQHRLGQQIAAARALVQGLEALRNGLATAWVDPAPLIKFDCPETPCPQKPLVESKLPSPASSVDGSKLQDAPIVPIAPSGHKANQVTNFIHQWWTANPAQRKALRQTAKAEGIFTALDHEIKKGQPARSSPNA